MRDAEECKVLIAFFNLEAGEEGEVKYKYDRHMVVVYPLMSLKVSFWILRK